MRRKINWISFPRFLHNRYILAAQLDTSLNRHQIRRFRGSAMSSRYATTSAIVFVLMLSSACASNRASPFREHRTPPAEALQACSAAEVSEACSFEGREGENVEGTCQTLEGEQLACKPTNQRRRSRSGGQRR